MKTRTLAAVTLAAALSACSAQFSAVSIFAICAPPTPDSSSGQCLYPATCAANLAETPVLDVTTAQLDFRLPVQINNTLVDNTNTDNGQINTNNAVITSFELHYAGVTLAPRTVSASVSVPAAGSSGALLHLITTDDFASIVPPGTGTTSVVVNVRGHGVLGSQDAFTTAWFAVPVEVCAGCLAGSFCPAGTVMASCPSAGLGATSPGQTATIACVTVQ